MQHQTIYEAAKAMDVAEAQQKLRDAHCQLLQLQREGRDDSKEADELRDTMDVYWLCLNYKTTEGGNGFIARVFDQPTQD